MRRPSQLATGTDLCQKRAKCLQIEQIGTDRETQSVLAFPQVKDSFKSVVYRSTDVFKLTTLIQDSRRFAWSLSGRGRVCRSYGEICRSVDTPRCSKHHGPSGGRAVRSGR
ncbi:hypothetical protein SEA_SHEDLOCKHOLMES_72 [Mycobacterium phage ShedlockHolmes]|uniref:Uncharacterized protein n=1 Tax=Mycobacterium phage ShedlockHolmes TaxID=1647313 RepID=A0A0F6YR30_9CAUD|nr:hypothetical protein SEA_SHEDLOCKHOLMES_72 [Mycobacterium phage ShedlockHolmes]AKF15249.1 hypothetical protein SEA_SHEDLOCKHOLMES_72 [Mycobacterium phage ShedlockHolmes]